MSVGRYSLNRSGGSRANRSQIKMLDFDVSTPLDFDRAIESLTNKNKQLYYKILVKFYNESLLKSINDTTKALN